MAEQLERFPESEVARYPWDVWGSGKVYRLTQGVDYECGTKTMVSMVRRVAWRRGMKARVSYRIRSKYERLPDSITFQFVDRGAGDMEGQTK